MQTLECDFSAQGGGHRGAYTDGLLFSLLPKLNPRSMSGTSVGGVTTLRWLWAEAEARKQGSRPGDEEHGMIVASAFETATRTFWKLTCNSAVQFSENTRQLGFCVPKPWQSPVSVAGWDAQSKGIAWLCQTGELPGFRQWRLMCNVEANDANPMLLLARASMPGIDHHLQNPELPRIVTNSVQLYTGQERLVENRSAAGRMSGATLKDFIATAIIPPLAPAIDGVWIDGALGLGRNGPMTGVIGQAPLPLIRSELGKVDFKAYSDSYRSHPELRRRADEALARLGDPVGAEPLPTDRPVHVFAYDRDESVPRGCMIMPEPEAVRSLLEEGRRAGRASLSRGLIASLTPRPATLAA